MKVRIIRSLTSAPAILGLAGLLSACVSPTDPEEPLFWEGTLEPRPTATVVVSGDASMVANQRDTHIGFVVDLVEEEPPTLAWLVRNGECSDTGERIAAQIAFPAPEVGISGRLSALAVLNRRITGSRFALELFLDNVETGENIACATLRRTNEPS